MTIKKEKTMLFINRLLKNWVVVFILIIFSVAIAYAIMFRPLFIKYGDAEIRSDKADIPKLK